MAPSADPSSSFGSDGPLREQGREPASGSAEIVARFRAAWAQHEVAGDNSTGLLPTRLAQACLTVLPIDGAGISLLDSDFRVPVGASDDTAALAERMQFTLGEGPCIDSASEHRVIVSDRDQLMDRWPLYAHELFTRTPFHGIAAIPLALTPGTHAALDLFVTDSSRLAAVSLAEVSTLGDQIVDALLLANALSPPAAQDTLEEPDSGWLRSPGARERTFVWVAMGMLMTEFDLVAPDALALMRSHAYSQGQDLDQLAADLASGKLEVDALRP